MKFGKRLAQEAARRFNDSPDVNHYFDYKACKKAVKADVAQQDVQGTHFQQLLVSELQKVSAYYSSRAAQLEAEFARCLEHGVAGAQRLQELRGEVQELIKFVALNYLAVVKSIKKRNRHLQENFGSAANTSLHALDLLVGEVFFTSPRLANLATQAEVLSRDLQGAAAALRSASPSSSSSSSSSCSVPHHHAPDATGSTATAAATAAAAAVAPLGAAAAAAPGELQAVGVQQQQQQESEREQRREQEREQERLLEEYQCPVCLDTLHNPVVLTCAHRFCWGCLVAHCTACREAALPLGRAAGPAHVHQHGSAAAQQQHHHHQPSDKEKGALPYGHAAAAGQQQRLLLPAPTHTYRVLEHLASSSEPEAPQFYPCPVCRKPQILDVDALQVDTYLDQFISSIQNLASCAATAATAHATHAAAPAQAPAASTTTATVVVESPPAAPAPAEHLVLRRAPSQHHPAAEREQEPHPMAAARQPSHAATLLIPEPWGVLPPQSPQNKGKLCVLLDLDGTLVSTFTPKRAPKLPPSVRTHLVGVGTKLNPHGVFVVERPGLAHFLERLAQFAEVVVFTAGLEDYASPIVDAVDPQRRFFSARIFREGTLRTDYYQCVKDLARLNRDLARTVLVDDTPLAFLHQPDNGVPILGFRGDPDDRLLLEAVLPLLQGLAAEKDVKPVLHRRFDMGAWFKRHGFPVEAIARQALVDAAAERERHLAEALRHMQLASKDAAAMRRAASGAPAQTAQQPHPAPQQHPARAAASHGEQPLPSLARAACLRPFSPPPPSATAHDWLFLSDFDKTLVDFDVGERLMEELAPELRPMLVQGVDDPAASWIPLTNTLLAEVQRRGVAAPALLAALRRVGAAELPPETAALLRALRASGVHAKVLSDANSVFISHVLAGARCAGLVHEVITNPAGFERPCGHGNGDGSGDGNGALPLGASPRATAAAMQPSAHGGGKPSPSSKLAAAVSAVGLSGRAKCSSGGGVASGGSGSAEEPCAEVAEGKLVVRPRHGGGGSGGRPAHQCSLCPPNLCKGEEVRALRASGAYRRVVYAGDGSNDVCAALCLGAGDVVLARAGHPLARYLQRAQAREPGTLLPQAQWRLWHTHQELHDLVLGFAAQKGGGGGGGNAAPASTL